MGVRQLNHMPFLFNSKTYYDYAKFMDFFTALLSKEKKECGVRKMKQQPLASYSNRQKI